MNPIGFRYHAQITVLDGAAVSPSHYLSGDSPYPCIGKKVPILRYAVYAQKKAAAAGNNKNSKTGLVDDDGAAISTSTPPLSTGCGGCVENNNTITSSSSSLCDTLVDLLAKVVSKTDSSLGVTTTVTTTTTVVGKKSEGMTTVWSASRTAPLAPTTATAPGTIPPPPLLSVNRAHLAPRHIPKHHFAEYYDSINKGRCSGGSGGEGVVEGGQDVPIQWTFLDIPPEEGSVSTGTSLKRSDVSVKTIPFTSRSALIQQLRRWTSSSTYQPPPSGSGGGGGGFAAPVPTWVSYILRELIEAEAQQQKQQSSSNVDASSSSSPYELVFVPFIQRHPAIDRSCFSFPDDATPSPSLLPHDSTLEFIPVATTTSSSTQASSSSPEVLLFTVVVPNRLRDNISPSPSSVAPFPMAMPLRGLVDEMCYLVSLHPKYGS